MVVMTVRTNVQKETPPLGVSGGAEFELSNSVLAEAR
jgi:hypothetical protein